MKGKSTNLDFELVQKTIDKLLERNEPPTVKKIREGLKISDDRSDELIGYFLYIWEQRHSTSHIEDISSITAEEIKNGKPDRSINKVLLERTKQLEESLSMMRATFNAAADAMFVISNEGKFVGYNEKFVKLFNFTKDILNTKDETVALNYALGQVSNPEELANLVTEKYKNPVSGNCGDMNFKNGKIVERYYQPQIVNEEVIGHVWSLRDITERRKSEENLRLRKRAIDSSTNAIIIATKQEKSLKIIYTNPAFTAITQYKSRDVIGKDVFSILYGANNIHEIKTLENVITKGKATISEFSLQRNIGDTIYCELHISPVKNSEDIVEHYICVLSDITERKKLEADLIHKATHDSLTELPNRSLIIDRIERSIIYAARTQKQFAVFFFDIDNFKIVNDTLGHDQGDKLLKYVAERLNNNVRAIDTIGRLGGDEFVLISNLIEDGKTVLSIPNRLLKLFSEPFDINNQIISITASIGGCIYPGDGQKVQALLKKADIAMYHAKSCGKNTYRFYQTGMNVELKKRLQIETLLRRALEKKDLFLVYQPIYDIQLQEIISVEALVRFKFLEDQGITVQEVIKVAEETGLINKMGEWVIQHACFELYKLRNETKKKLNLLINISGVQIRDDAFLKDVLHIINKSHFPIENVEFEITETVLVSASENIKKTIEELTKVGANFSLDDFGTGYSSLSYLHQFPIAKLKVDKSFIDKIEASSREKLLIKAIISMAQSLGMKTVAEGVETKVQYEYLKKSGCDEIQGYFFSKPLLIEDLRQLVKSKR